MSSQGIVSSVRAGTSPGLYPIKRQSPGLSSWARALNQLTSLSVGTDKTPPHCHMLVVYPAFYLFPYILPGNPQGRLAQIIGEQFFFFSQASWQFYFHCFGTHIKKF